SITSSIYGNDQFRRASSRNTPATYSANPKCRTESWVRYRSSHRADFQGRDSGRRRVSLSSPPSDGTGRVDRRRMGSYREKSQSQVLQADSKWAKAVEERNCPLERNFRSDDRDPTGGL